eukprot:6200058-Pleurochrysis_carterae.AAC.1
MPVLRASGFVVVCCLAAQAQAALIASECRLSEAEVERMLRDRDGGDEFREMLPRRRRAAGHAPFPVTRARLRPLICSLALSRSFAISLTLSMVYWPTGHLLFNSLVTLARQRELTCAANLPIASR